MPIGLMVGLQALNLAGLGSNPRWASNLLTLLLSWMRGTLSYPSDVTSQCSVARAIREPNSLMEGKPRGAGRRLLSERDPTGLWIKTTAFLHGE